MKRIAVGWFCGGVLFAITLAAPLSGAASSLFWRSQADISHGWGDDALAAQDLLVEIEKNWGASDLRPAAPMPPIWNRADTGDTRDCGARMLSRPNAFQKGPHLTLTHIYGAMVHEEQRNSKQGVDVEAQRSFMNLSRPALGAVAECAQHSVFSLVCTYWARAHLEGDKVAQTRIAAHRLTAAKNSDDQACLLLDMQEQSDVQMTVKEQAPRGENP